MLFTNLIAKTHKAQSIWLRLFFLEVHCFYGCCINQSFLFADQPTRVLGYYWKCTRNDGNLRALIFHKGRWKTLGISALLPHVRLQQILHLSFSQRPGKGIIHIICKNDVNYAIHLREKLSIRLTKIEYVNSFFGNLTAFMKKRTLLTFSCISNVYFLNQLVQSLHLE